MAATTPEGKVKAQVRAYLKEEHVWFFAPTTYGMGRSGVPDFVCCVNGCFLTIECKAGKGKPTAIQAAEMAGIRACGGMTLVINEANLPLIGAALRALRALPMTVLGFEPHRAIEGD